MNWYICIITSTDYYTMYDSTEIVKAHNSVEAQELAKKSYIAREWKNYPNTNGGFGEYRQVESVINCGKRKPVIE